MCAGDSVASEIKSMVDELKSKFEKDRYKVIQNLYFP